MKISGLALPAATIVLAIWVAALEGCNSNEYSWGKVSGILQSSPVKLDAEYVMLSQGQFDCGVQNDLWEPASSNGARSTARLLQKGRDLKFSDDVSLGDLRFPYVQIRGDFSLGAVAVSADHDGPEVGTKLVEAKVGAIVSHSCFPNPLQIMGVRKGAFTQDAPPMLLFHLSDNWQFDHFVH